jgi:hypothetical protein
VLRPPGSRRHASPQIPIDEDVEVVPAEEVVLS